MKSLLAVLFLAFAAAGTNRAAEPVSVEATVAAAVQGPGVTVVHFWAPWCPNCRAELENQGWSGFLAANPEVKFIFVTIWQGTSGDGRALLAKFNVGAQPNFQLLVHPNASRKKDEKLDRFLDLPITWIPSTWIFKEGKLRYALNYGELRFPLLQQLIADSSDRWSH